MALLREEIEKALETLAQGLRTHGGDVEFVDMDHAKGLVKIRLHGACVGCPLSELTVKQVIEIGLQEKLPWIKEVKAVE